MAIVTVISFERLARLLDSAATLLRPGVFSVRLGLCVLSWGLEGLSLYLIAQEVGVGISLATGNRHLRHCGAGRRAVVPARRTG